jgi:hypothetical protein
VTTRHKPISAAIAQQLIDAIARGATLRQLCKQRRIDPNAFYNALDADESGAAVQRYAQARVRQAHSCFDEMVDVARRTTPANANAVRVKVDALKFATMKLAPRIYGDALVIKGDADNPIAIAINERLDAVKRRLTVIDGDAKRVA